MKIKKRKRVKQATALALSAVMAMSGLPYVPYLGANVVYAATPAWTTGSVLPSENITDSLAKWNGNTYYNSSESTAFVVGKGYATGGTNAGYQYEDGTQFNIAAVLSESSRTDATAGYNDTVKTAYLNNWWVTRYAFSNTTDGG